MSSLKSRVIKAGSWTLAGYLINQAVRLISSLIMTRLLTPDMFGVMAVAFIFIMAMEMFSDIGLQQVVVRSERGEQQRFLNTVWSIQIIRGFIIALVICAVAYLVFIGSQKSWFPAGSTYANPELPFVIATLSLSAVLSGFRSTKVLTASRNMILGRTTVIGIISQILSLVFMVILAINSPSVYVLVLGAVFAAFINTLLSHTSLPGINNKFEWCSATAKEVIGFGKWVFLTSIMGFLIANGDKVLFGWLVPAETMGFYAIAVLLFGSVQNIVNKLIATVAFPLLGEVHRNKKENIADIYYKIRLPVDAFCLFMAGFLFVSGSAIVSILYDDRYSRAGEIFEILAVSLFVLRFSVAGQFYYILGKPQIMTLLMSTRLTMMTVLIFAGFHYYGFIGAVWGLAVSGIPGLVVTFSLKKQLGLFNLKKELFFLVFIPTGVLIGIIFVYIIKLIL